MPVGLRGDDTRRATSYEFIAARQHDHVALDAERALENQVRSVRIVRGRIGIRFEDTHASFAVARNGMGERDLNILAGIRMAAQAMRLGFGGAHHFELQTFASSGIDDALVGCDGPAAEGIE